MAKANVCSIIAANPDETLLDASDKQLAEAAVAIIGMMTTEGYNTLAVMLSEQNDETSFDGLLSALERNQPE